jgi:hypothetical protein
MTLGAAQILAKAHGVLPGRRILLAGSGPLLLALAHELVRRGAPPLAVLEATHPGAWLPHAPHLWGNWERLAEASVYLRSLRRAHVPYRFGRTVVEALGQERLAVVRTARLDAQGRPIPGSEERLEVDALCLGFGFLPNIELTQLAGCEHEFDLARGGWVPQVDETLETSLPGLYAAGESAGVGGADAALLEGRIAGLAAAHRLGCLEKTALQAELAALRPARRRLRRFAGMLNTLFQPPSGLHDLITDDTVLCRCEEVTAGQVREALHLSQADGSPTTAIALDGLKIWSRVGQGHCQGRTCGPLLRRFIAHETGGCEQEAGSFRVRPPLKPVPLGHLGGRE